MEVAGEEVCPPEQGYLLVRIHVPEINVQKCLQFPRDQLVWDVKQQCLAALPKELKESFNYGLFSPPENGRAGKFLDEERRLGDYPFNGPVGYLELKYKRRVYKMLSLDEKQLKGLHTRANLRRFLDYVASGHVEKITKMCSKGLDPNFHCQDSGETPLTIASSTTVTKKSSRVLIALVNGGAHLDYRTRDGATAMHRSVEHRHLEAMRTLLELGASPNYKDARGLTPLYLTCVLGSGTGPGSASNGGSGNTGNVGGSAGSGGPGGGGATSVEATFTEVLLHDHATIGAQDLQGWQEVHQVCKTGLTAHLEHLLGYGANMDSRNASGNTPLHVCAVNGQESCARQLLFRGADREALNYANQTPGQVAVIAGNMELAELIQHYRQEEVVPMRRPPTYNPNRRSAVGWLSRPPSMSCISAAAGGGNNSLLMSPTSTVTSPTMSIASGNLHHHSQQVQQHSYHNATYTISGGGGGGPTQLPPAPSSPCPSDRSSVPYSSASSSMSDGSATSGGNGRHHLHHHHMHHHHLHHHNHGNDTDTASIVTVLALGVTDKSLGDTSDIISDSSGVGTANSDTTVGSVSMPGSTVVCIETYTPSTGGNNARDEDGHISIREGDIIEVTGATDDGLLEGTVKSNSGRRINGLFPISCVQEVRLRYNNIQPPIMIAPRDTRPNSIATSVTTSSQLSNNNNQRQQSQTGGEEGRVTGRRESNGGQQQQQHFATAPRLKKSYDVITSEPRTVVLHRGHKGFGFILRGAKATSPLMELTPASGGGKFPALQYLDDVDPGGVADMAGLRKGDYLLEINREDVSAASHEHVVDLIRKSRDLVSMTVVSLLTGGSQQTTGTLPYSKSSILVQSGNNTSSHNMEVAAAAASRQYATLPRKANASGASSAGGTLTRTPAPLPPRRDPKTTLSVGRARAKSMVAGLEGTVDRDDTTADDDLAKSTSAESIHQSYTSIPNAISQQSHQQQLHHSGTPNNSNNNTMRTASIRQRPTSRHMTTAELEELFQRQQQCNSGTGASAGGGNTGQYQQEKVYGGGMMMTTSHFTNESCTTTVTGSPHKVRVYASVNEMKRSKSKGSSKVRFTNPAKLGELHRHFHSTPDLALTTTSPSQTQYSIGNVGNYGYNSLVMSGSNRGRHRSQEDISVTMMKYGSGAASAARNTLPPPNHPPPPPPTGQVIKVDVSRGNSTEYDGPNCKESSESIVSSFRPTAHAKLYESPGDVKQHVIYYNRSRSLPSHASRVRKSHSMRTPSVATNANNSNATPNATTFKPSNTTTSAAISTSTTTATTVSAQPQNNNPYAQPTINYHHRPSRSHSTVTNREQGLQQQVKGGTLRGVLTRSQTVDAVVQSAIVGGNVGGGRVSTPPPPPPPPAIPEPDYSCSGSDSDDEVGKNMSKLSARLNSVQLHPVENSGTSNTSGSSSGSSSIPHSFSVDEIQKGRALLKSSKSYPDNLLKRHGDGGGGHHLIEDGDNSSSGVSSDQEVNGGGGGSSGNSGNTAEYGDNRLIGNTGPVEKCCAAPQTATVVLKTQRITSGIQSKHAVSLVQLPPPQEAETDDKEEFCLPPPPEFNAATMGTISASATTTGGGNPEPVVLAPPPQFSDAARHLSATGSTVRIVGAVPKANAIKGAKFGHLKSTGRLHSQ